VSASSSLHGCRGVRRLRHRTSCAQEEFSATVDSFSWGEGDEEWVSGLKNAWKVGERGSAHCSKAEDGEGGGTAAFWRECAMRRMIFLWSVCTHVCGSLPVCVSLSVCAPVPVSTSSAISDAPPPPLSPPPHARPNPSPLCSFTPTQVRYSEGSPHDHPQHRLYHPQPLPPYPIVPNQLLSLTCHTRPGA
jgi:hypothetical protein